MTGRRTRDRVRQAMYGYLGWATCPPCGRFVEDCACVCAFCGERNGCRCCIGFGLATGGD